MKTTTDWQWSINKYWISLDLVQLQQQFQFTPVWLPVTHFSKWGDWDACRRLMDVNTRHECQQTETVSCNHQAEKCRLTVRLAFWWHFSVVFISSAALAADEGVSVKYQHQELSVKHLQSQTQQCYSPDHFGFQPFWFSSHSVWNKIIETAIKFQGSALFYKKKKKKITRSVKSAVWSI